MSHSLEFRFQQFIGKYFGERKPRAEQLECMRDAFFTGAIDGRTMDHKVLVDEVSAYLATIPRPLDN